MIIPSLESTKVDLGLPVFTLDVNQVALKDPSHWTPSMQGLAPLEWNYFKTHQVELCVTPELNYEITRGQPLDELPWIAYQRFKKSQLFKSRPSGATLSLTEQEASILWSGIREIIWPTVPETRLTHNQRADVSELYFHTVANSTLSNSAFLTNDSDFLSRANDIRSELGVTVMAPTPAWEEYQPKFDLYAPSPTELETFLAEQRSHLQQLSTRSNL